MNHANQGVSQPCASATYRIKCRLCGNYYGAVVSQEYSALYYIKPRNSSKAGTPPASPRVSKSCACPMGHGQLGFRLDYLTKDASNLI